MFLTTCFHQLRRGTSQKRLSVEKTHQVQVRQQNFIQSIFKIKHAKLLNSTTELQILTMNRTITKQFNYVAAQPREERHKHGGEVTK